MYSHREYYEMMQVYIESGGNLAGARRLYEAESLPRLRAQGLVNARVPRCNTILAANQRLLDYGQFTVPILAQGGGAPRLPISLEDKIIDFFEMHPRASTSQAARRFRISQPTVYKLLKSAGLLHQTEAVPSQQSTSNPSSPVNYSDEESLCSDSEGETAVSKKSASTTSGKKAKKNNAETEAPKKSATKTSGHKAKKKFADPRQTIHEGVKCDKCGNQIIGFRYVCLECIDFDLCSACESHGVHDEHYVLRIPAPRTQSEIEKVLQRIRNEIMEDEIMEVISQTNTNSELRQNELDSLSVNEEEPEIKVEQPENVDPDPLGHAPAQIEAMETVSILYDTDSNRVVPIYKERQPQAPVTVCRKTQDDNNTSDQFLVLQVNPVSDSASEGQDIPTVKVELFDDFDPDTVDASEKTKPNEMEFKTGDKRSKQTDKLKAKRSKVKTAESTSDKAEAFTGDVTKTQEKMNVGQLRQKKGQK